MSVGSQTDPWFEVDHRLEHGVVVVRLAGEIDLYSGPRLDHVVRCVEAEPMAALELDLAGTDYLDSIGVTALFRLVAVARAHGVPVRVRGERPAVRSLLELVGFHAVAAQPARRPGNRPAAAVRDLTQT